MLEELKELDNELWCALIDANIRTEKQVKIGNYIYHLTKAGYVDRIHYLDSRGNNSWREPDQEKHLSRFKIKGQQQLTTDT